MNLSLFFLITELLFLGVFLFLLYAAFVSFYEKEKRAGNIFLLADFIVAIAGGTLYHYSDAIPTGFFICFIAVSLVAILLLFLPIGNKSNLREQPEARIDERIVMFSRNRLEEGSENYKQYYLAHPDHLDLDNKFRGMPGLLSAQAHYFEPYLFSAANANFKTVEAFHAILEDKKNAVQQPVIAEDVSKFLTSWVKSLGAHSVGITTLKDYHLYSHVGRGEDFGQEVTLHHKYAIAFTVEMDQHLMAAAPYSPVVMESSQQYLHSGTIAVQVAEWIKDMGYAARAHIDGNYRVVCPLVARDAGLGEIGRMGLLMTPKLGPRVRIAVVTTDIPLIESQTKYDPSVEAFCDICKKCAYTCPAAAIPKNGKNSASEPSHWQINQEACFTLWCKVGTDCGKCMRVCPYSHPNNLLHNVIRFGIKQNAIFRHVAVTMDDFFYKKNPKPVLNTRWLKGKVSLKK